MATSRPAQVNIRSESARRRLDDLVRKTGMTATRIVEDALARYVPVATIDDDEILPPGLKREGRLLVLTGGPRWTVDEVQESIDETREGVRD